MTRAVSSSESRRGAIATCARHALSVADLAELLGMLGLDGSAVEIVEVLRPPPSPTSNPVEHPDPELASALAEAWSTAAELADNLEQARRALARLLYAVTVAGCPDGARDEVVTATGYLESMPRAG